MSIISSRVEGPASTGQRLRLVADLVRCAQDGPEMATLLGDLAEDPSARERFKEDFYSRTADPTRSSGPNTGLRLEE